MLTLRSGLPSLIFRIIQRFFEKLRSIPQFGYGFVGGYAGRTTLGCQNSPPLIHPRTDI